MAGGFGDSTLRKRLLRGAGASALGPLVTVAVQLGTVPLLLHSWGPAKYGDWVILSAVPNYFNLTSLGFGDASASDMTARTAANDHAGALRTYQSSWALLAVLSVAALLLSFLTVPLLPLQSWMRLSTLTSRDAGSVLLALILYVVIGQQMGILESGFRSDGNYAFGTMFLNLSRFGETLLSTLAALWTGSLLTAALVFLLSRFVSVVSYAWLLHVKSPWLILGFRHASYQAIRSLAGPAFGFVLLPLGYALSIQGFTIVVGAELGSLAVTSFSTLRTLTRFTFQLLNVVGNTVWPELSAAFGAGNLGLARRLNRRGHQIALGLSLLCVAALWVAGPFVYRLWIGHAVTFDTATFHILLLDTLVSSLWYVSSVVPMAANAHQGVALAFALISAAGCAGAWFVVPTTGLAGAASFLLAIDVVMACIALHRCLQLLGDRLLAFVAALFEPPSWRKPFASSEPEPVGPAGAARP